MRSNFMGKKRVSFIIVTWNNENEIEKCLDTLKEYTKVPYQVIVVDNLSKDHTCDIISKRYPEVQLIRSKENLGFAKGNNLALGVVTTPYLCFINPDVILTEDITGPALKILDSDKSVGLVTNKLYNADGSHQATTGRFTDYISILVSVGHLTRFLPNSLKMNFCPEHYKLDRGYFYPDWVIGAEMFMRTADAKEIGGFSTDYYMYIEDMDICWKVRHQLNKLVYYNADVSMVHLGGVSEKQNRSYSKQEKLYTNTFLFCQKFYGRKKAVNLFDFWEKLYNIRVFFLYALSMLSKGQDFIKHDKSILKILESILEIEKIKN